MIDVFLSNAANAASDRRLDSFFSVIERRKRFTRQALEGVWLNTLVLWGVEEANKDVLQLLSCLRGVLTCGLKLEQLGTEKIGNFINYSQYISLFFL